MHFIDHLTEEVLHRQRRCAASGADAILVEMQFALHAKHRLVADFGRHVAAEPLGLLRWSGGTNQRSEMGVEVVAITIPGVAIEARREYISEGFHFRHSP